MAKMGPSNDHGHPTATRPRVFWGPYHTPPNTYTKTPKKLQYLIAATLTIRNLSPYAYWLGYGSCEWLIASRHLSAPRTTAKSQNSTHRSKTQNPELTTHNQQFHPRLRLATTTITPSSNPSPNSHPHRLSPSPHCTCHRTTNARSSLRSLDVNATQHSMTPIPLVTDVTCHTFYKELFPLHIINNDWSFVRLPLLVRFAVRFRRVCEPAGYLLFFSSHSASEGLYIAWWWLRWLSSFCSLHLYLYIHSTLHPSLSVYPKATPKVTPKAPNSPSPSQ